MELENFTFNLPDFVKEKGRVKKKSVFFARFLLSLVKNKFCQQKNGTI